MASIPNDLADFVLYHNNNDDSTFVDMLSQEKLDYDSILAQQSLVFSSQRPHQNSFDQYTVSSSSTAQSSPYMTTEQTIAPSELLAPSIVHESFGDFSWPTMADDGLFGMTSSVDPSLLRPMGAAVAAFGAADEAHQASAAAFLAEQQNFDYFPSQAPSPAPSNRSSTQQRPGSAAIKAASSSPYLSTANYQPYDASSRRPSTISRHSSHDSTTSRRADSEDARDETKTGRAALCEKCGKRFQDIKAHNFTHQEERPEKCSIVTCEWHIKGFARKYDCQRHLLTHYKGTMVCGFCPNSGSAAEKSFNRADVFKRHLMAVHNVEQPPPSGRKRSSPSTKSASTVKAAVSTAKDDAPAKCSICAHTFTNAQAFYDHLDNCVLVKVGQEEPSERINAANLASVENDAFVLALNDNQPILPLSPPSSSSCASSDDEDDDEVDTKKAKKPRAAKGAKGVFTWSVGGVSSKGRTVANNNKKNKRTTLPPAWGLPVENLTMKKRVLTVFDGPQRMWKDEMMLSNDLEVLLELGDGAQCTDLDLTTLERTDASFSELDYYTLQRSEAILDATDAEKGPYENRDLGWNAGKYITSDM